MTTINKLLTEERIKFGKPCVAWNTSDLSKGGMVRVSFSVALDNRMIGTVHVGATIYADASCITLVPRIAEAVRKYGYAVESFRDGRWEEELETPSIFEIAPDDQHPARSLITAAEIEADWKIRYDQVFRQALLKALPVRMNDDNISTAMLLTYVRRNAEVRA